MHNSHTLLLYSFCKCYLQFQEHMLQTFRLTAPQMRKKQLLRTKNLMTEENVI